MITNYNTVCTPQRPLSLSQQITSSPQSQRVFLRFQFTRQRLGRRLWDLGEMEKENEWGWKRHSQKWLERGCKKMGTIWDSREKRKTSLFRRKERYNLDCLSNVEIPHLAHHLLSPEEVANQPFFSLTTHTHTFVFLNFTPFRVAEQSSQTGSTTSTASWKKAQEEKSIQSEPTTERGVEIAWVHWKTHGGWKERWGGVCLRER